MAGNIVRNPIWRDIPKKKVDALSKRHDVCSPKAPSVMHLDILLIRKNSPTGRGEIYTYFSRDWQTSLLPFRQWLPDDKPGQRRLLNARKIGRHWEVPLESVSVEPLSNQYAVSFKPHAKLGDLILYIFQFCAVRFEKPSAYLRKQLGKPASDNELEGPWFDLRTLRASPTSWKVNADILRSIHLLFTVNLDGLATSFPDEWCAKVGETSMPHESPTINPANSGTLTTNQVVKRDKLFISYCHKDAKFLKELLLHLKPLERAGLIAKWSDEEIAPGSKWFEEIKAALATTKVAVMMVSPGFLASDFIHEHELGPLLKEAEQGGVRILWIPVRASVYKETPLKNYQAVISPDKSIAEMKAERDKAWVKICEEIKKALNPK